MKGEEEGERDGPGVAVSSSWSSIAACSAWRRSIVDASGWSYQTGGEGGKGSSVMDEGDEEQGKRRREDGPCRGGAPPT